MTIAVLDMVKRIRVAGPNGVWRDLPCVWNIPSGWGRLHTNGEYAGKAYISTEIIETDEFCSDEPALYARNIRQRRFSGNTEPANITYGDVASYNVPASPPPYWWKFYGASTGEVGDYLDYHPTDCIIHPVNGY